MDEVKEQYRFGSLWKILALRDETLLDELIDLTKAETAMFLENEATKEMMLAMSFSKELSDLKQRLKAIK